MNYSYKSYGIKLKTKQLSKSQNFSKLSTSIKRSNTFQCLYVFCPNVFSNQVLLVLPFKDLSIQQPSTLPKCCILKSTWVPDTFLEGLLQLLKLTSPHLLHSKKQLSFLHSNQTNETVLKFSLIPFTIELLSIYLLLNIQLSNSQNLLITSAFS